MRDALQHLLLAAALGVAALACNPPEEPAPPPVASPVVEQAKPASPVSDRELLGIDVSHHSGEVDWSAVASGGHDFAFVKATEGIDNIDPHFADHWDALEKSGLIRGAYHFYVTEDDPEQQARHYLSTVRFAEGDFVPVVDVELIGRGTSPGLPGRLRQFLKIVEQETGVRPLVYTMPNFWNEQIGRGFADYPLWIAEYGVEAPRVPDDWADWHLWQFRGDAKIPGVEKTADVSRIRAGTDLGSIRFPAAPAGD